MDKKLKIYIGQYIRTIESVNSIGEQRYNLRLRVKSGDELQQH